MVRQQTHLSHSSVFSLKPVVCFATFPFVEVCIISLVCHSVSGVNGRYGEQATFYKV